MCPTLPSILGLSTAPVTVYQDRSAEPSCPVLPDISLGFSPLTLDKCLLEHELLHISWEISAKQRLPEETVGSGWHLGGPGTEVGNRLKHQKYQFKILDILAEPRTSSPKAFNGH